MATTILLAFVLGAAPAAGFETDSFEKAVLPIFKKRCTGCHGEDKQRGGLRLDSLEALAKGAKSGAAIVPGKSADSLLVRMIEGTGKKVMPPAGQGDRLSADEIRAIRAWIDAGARGPAAGAPSAPAPAPTAPQSLATAAVAVASSASASVRFAEPVAAAAISPDRRLLVLGGFGRASLLDAESGAALGSLEGLNELVRAAACFESDGALRLALGGGLTGRGGEIQIWRLGGAVSPGAVSPGAVFPGAVLERTLRGHSDAVYALAVSRGGKLLATSSYDRLIKLWDPASGAELKTLKDHVDAVFGLEFFPDVPSPLSPPKGTLTRLASCGADRTVKVWDTSQGTRLYTLSDSTDALSSVAIHPSGERLAAGGADRMLRVWKLGAQGGELHRSTFAHQGGLLKVLYSTDGATIYTAGEDRRVKAWDSDTLAEKQVYEAQSDWPLALAFDAAGRLAVGRYDGRWAVYDSKSGKTLLSPELVMAARPAAGSAKESASKADAPAGAKAVARGKETAVNLDRDSFEVAVVDPGNLTVPPSLSSASLRALSRGGKAELTIDGRNLAGAEIVFSHPALAASILENQALPRPDFRRTRGNTGAEIVDTSVPHKLKVALTVAPDAPPGLHSFIARTSLGATNSISFHVDAWPETAEHEPNGPDAAQETAPGAVMVGRMDSSGDVDAFRFSVREGQELVFDVVGSALGSSLNGLLTLHDAGGKELASSAEFAPRRADARLAYRFPAAGAYSVRLADREFRAGGFYRLRIGELPLVTGVFPLGLQRGTEASVRVRGFNLGGMEAVKVSVPAAAAPRSTLPVPVPADLVARLGAPLDAGRLSVGDASESIETEADGSGGNDDPAKAERVGSPFTANGIIDRGRENARGRDADCYRFAARRGQKLLVEVEAERLGSPLDPLVEVLDSAGQPIERAVLRPVARTFVTLSDRDARSSGLRLDAWSDLRLNDHVLVGNEVLKVRGLPDYGDEDVIFFSRGGNRIGYFDTTPNFHAVGDATYKVEAYPPGSTFSPNGMPLFHLYYRNDDGSPGMGRDSLLHFDPPADGEFVARVTDSLGQGGPAHAYRLSVREARPDFRLSLDTYHLNLPAGGRLPVNVRVDRADDFDGEVRVRIEGLPEGVRAEAAPVLPGEESAAFMVTACRSDSEGGPAAKSTGTDFTYRVIGRADIGGREETRETRGGMITVISPADIVLSVDQPEIEIVPGGKARVKVKVERQNGFKARVPLDVVNLPHGVYVMDTGLNGILITEKEDERTYVIFAEPWVKPFTRTFFTTAIVETRSPVASRHAASAQVIRLKPARPVSQSF